MGESGLGKGSGSFHLPPGGSALADPGQHRRSPSPNNELERGELSEPAHHQGKGSSFEAGDPKGGLGSSFRLNPTFIRLGIYS